MAMLDAATGRLLRTVSLGTYVVLGGVAGDPQSGRGFLLTSTAGTTESDGGVSALVFKPASLTRKDSVIKTRYNDGGCGGVLLMHPYLPARVHPVMHPIRCTHHRRYRGDIKTWRQPPLRPAASGASRQR